MRVTMSVNENPELDLGLVSSRRGFDHSPSAPCDNVSYDVEIDNSVSYHGEIGTCSATCDLANEFVLFVPRL